MTREEITRMAREAGILPDEDGSHYWISHDSELQCFAALVADAEAKRMHDEGFVTVGHMRQQIAAEREAWAKLIDSRKTGANKLMDAVRDMEARAIRARGQA